MWPTRLPVALQSCVPIVQGLWQAPVLIAGLIQLRVCTWILIGSCAPTCDSWFLWMSVDVCGARATVASEAIGAVCPLQCACNSCAIELLEVATD